MTAAAPVLDCSATPAFSLAFGFFAPAVAASTGVSRLMADLAAGQVSARE